MEALAAEGRWPALRDFPRNGAELATLMAGAFLADRGFGGLECVRGARGRGADDSLEVHAWLRSGPLVLDVVADRFEDAPLAVIVASPSPWHETFRVERPPQPADFRICTGPGLLHLMYARMLERLPD